MMERTMKSAMQECWDVGYSEVTISLKDRWVSGTKNRYSPNAGCTLWFEKDAIFQNFIDKLPVTLGLPRLTLTMSPDNIPLLLCFEPNKRWGSEYYTVGSERWFRNELLGIFEGTAIPTIEKVQVSQDVSQNRWLYSDMRINSIQIKVQRELEPIVSDFIKDLKRRVNYGLFKQEKPKMKFNQLTDKTFGTQFRLPYWDEDKHVYAKRDSDGQISWYDNDHDDYYFEVDEIIQDCWQICEQTHFGNLTMQEAVHMLNNKAAKKIWMDSVAWKNDFGYLYLNDFGKLCVEKGVSQGAAGDAMLKGTVSVVKWQASK